MNILLIIKGRWDMIRIFLIIQIFFYSAMVFCNNLIKLTLDGSVSYCSNEIYLITKTESTIDSLTLNTYLGRPPNKNEIISISRSPEKIFFLRYKKKYLSITKENYFIFINSDGNLEKKMCNSNVDSNIFLGVGICKLLDSNVDFKLSERNICFSSNFLYGNIGLIAETIYLSKYDKGHTNFRTEENIGKLDITQLDICYVIDECRFGEIPFEFRPYFGNGFMYFTKKFDNDEYIQYCFSFGASIRIGEKDPKMIFDIKFIPTNRKIRNIISNEYIPMLNIGISFFQKQI
jgi:hypothetical protein